MENKETEYKKLMDTISSYMSSENIDLINKYYNYALKIYDGMTRMTGFFDSRMCACVCITNHICLSYLSLKEIINWKA